MKKQVPIQVAIDDIHRQIADLRGAIMTVQALNSLNISLNKMTLGALIDLGFASPDSLRSGLEQLRDEANENPEYQHYVSILIESMCPAEQSEGRAQEPRLRLVPSPTEVASENEQ